MQKRLAVIKCVTILAFLVTLSATYFLRSEVLKLSTIRFSSENARADESLRELKESYPVRMAEHEAQTKHYEIQMAHYRKMLDLYNTDYKEYVKRIKDHYRPPELPRKPAKPKSPELSEQLARNNAAFRSQQYQYFSSSRHLNWVCCVSALVLVGGLLLLMMFESGAQRVFYLAILVLSFIFMIGPAFHSIISTIVGFLEAPSIY